MTIALLNLHLVLLLFYIVLIVPERICQRCGHWSAVKWNKREALWVNAGYGCQLDPQGNSVKRQIEIYKLLWVDVT